MSTALAPGPQPLAIEVVEHGARCELAEPAAPVLRRALQSPWVTTLVYGVAGLGYALVLAIVWFQATGIEMRPMRTLVYVWGQAWPIVLTANLVTAAGWRGQARNVALYFGGWSATFLLTQNDLLYMPIFWAVTAGPPTVLVAIFLHRKLRAVGPLVFAFMVVAVGGLHLATTLAATDRFGEVVLALPVDATGVITLFVGVLLFGLALFGLFGWWAIGWIRRQYERKRTSDQSLIVDSIWLIFTLAGALAIIFEGTGWAIASLGAFVAYKTLAWLGFAIVERHTGERQNYRLLLLRVFGSSRRSERLMDVVGSRWRYAGSIQLIMGTDLATAIVEPHQFLDFVRGKLQNRYVKSRDGLERSLNELDLCPDRDGRFRVNEFFCHDDTWRMTLSRLVASSDAVLMDLRGFSPANQGCVFELNELVNLAPLCKVVLIVDRTTDEPFLRAILDRAWEAMSPTSPNSGPHCAPLTICRLTRDDPPQAGATLLLTTLARAVTTGTAPQPRELEGHRE